MVKMTFKKSISPKVFHAIQNVDIEELSKCSEQEIRPILPCLVRMSLISPLDTSKKCSGQKIDILTIISGIEYVNSIVALLSIDFHALESDVRKEQLLRQKSSTTQNDSVLISNLPNGLALEYERSDMTRRLRLVLSELLFIQSQIQDTGENHSEQEFYMKSSELFDNDIYIEEISDVICIALAELPMLLNVQTMAETLLHVHNGPAVICRVVANFPDSFREVCTNLILKGEKQEEHPHSAMRLNAISLLCKMNPSQALAVRSKCVELCRMPALAITLSLDNAGRNSSVDQDNDMVAFVSGLLLGNDQAIRNWFAMFIRTGQKRKGEVSSTALQQLRDNLLWRLQNIIQACPDGQLLDSYVVQASALLRLYCALRGIAAIKFQDEEVNLIVQLLTSHPSPTPAGVRFASLGLCMLIACPSLVSQPEHEKRSIDWVQWLVREEAYFESTSGVSASFGEMLLLMAIHFHSNQLSAICDLVCATLGMKIPIRHNNMTRMKQVFTQEIFTEQVVTSHAVKVPVTPNLNANMAGFLPVHCIHQLLKSRAFAKHNVNIKSWIYRQICASTSPLHPVLPLLVEVYVTSIILSNSRNLEITNKPLSENEIRRVFQSSIFGQYFDPKRSIFNLEFDISSDYENVFINETSLTPQLLLLYYLLLYEDCRLTNAQNLTASGRKIKIYSAEFMSELPIKYLLHHAQKDQSSYSGLFGPLLKLLATHFPHLTLVEDWLDDMSFKTDYKSAYISEMAVVEAFNCLETNPSKCAKMMQVLLKKEAIDIWPFAEIFTQFAKKVLDKNVPRYLQDLYKDVWLRLNTVLPRRLWVLTVKNVVGDLHGLTRSDVADDPLQIMRCDERVFRCAPIYAIMLRVLRASLASSRSQLFQHLQSNPKLDQNGQVVSDTEREEMCRALVAAQIEFNIKMDRKRYRDSKYERPHTSRDSQRYYKEDSYSSKRHRYTSPEIPSNPKEIINRNKHELNSFLQDRLNIRSTDDFWKFFDKYQTLQAARINETNNLDKKNVINLDFDSNLNSLYSKLPVNIPKEVFKNLTQTVLVYQDFQQKSKFAKLKKLRSAQNDLPIAQYKNKIVEALQESRVILIAGDTGCGKSTQVPQYVVEAGYNKIVCTQPRRIACVSLSKRVAYETLTDFKSTIGYQIRFEKTKRADTAVIFMTEGLLLRQAAEEETISAYDIIILDEIHERHLYGDFLIGIMKCLLHKRDDFKLILMSATINIELFENYFGDEGIKVIEVPGRLYPIEIQYKPIIKDPYERKRDKFDSSPYLQIIQMIDEKYPPHHKGDLLIFLNGIAEITALADAVTEYSNIKRNWIVLQLHSTLSLEEQDKVFDYPPEGMRKCIISTNIAETSVTIDGVRFVIDSGKVNRMIYHTSGGINKLMETNISQDSGKQRSGRAGRTGPGTCYRMYSEENFKNFDAFTTAEIHLVPLESLLLHMISLGLTDIQNFPFLEKPSGSAIEESIDKLKFCGALKLNEDYLMLTPLGEALSRLPVDLTIGKMLIMSTIFGNINSVLAMAAILSIQSPLTQQAYRSSDMQNARKPLESTHGDPISLLSMYKEWLCIKQETVPVAGSSKSKENSRSWAKKRGLEEQRFYEITKLIQQFRDILEDAELLPKGIEQELSSSERAIRHGELKQLKNLRRTLKDEARSTQRKQLKYENFNLDSEDSNTPHKLDIRDIEFRITNDFKKLQKLLDESSPDSYKDLMMLKLILTSGLYPQVAVEDEFNYSKSVSDRLYHTKNKNFVFLRPLSCFTTNPEVLEIHADDIEVPPPGYFSKRPISRKHQILIFQSILETKKVYLMNVMRMPGIQTLMLFSKTIATNMTLTKFVFDEFLMIDAPHFGQGKTLLVRAINLRKKWKIKLEEKLHDPSVVSETNMEDIFYFIEDLVKFTSTEVSCNIKRLLPADLKVIYTYNDEFSFKIEENPFDAEFKISLNKTYGGLQVTENVVYGCLAQEEWAENIEEQVDSTPFECPHCLSQKQGLSFLEIMQHEAFCKKQENSVVKNLNESEKIEVIKPNSRNFYCENCKKDLILTPVDILKHKRTCV